MLARLQAPRAVKGECTSRRPFQRTYEHNTLPVLHGKPGRSISSSAPVHTFFEEPYRHPEERRVIRFYPVSHLVPPGLLSYTLEGRAVGVTCYGVKMENRIGGREINIETWKNERKKKIMRKRVKEKEKRDWSDQQVE